MPLSGLRLFDSHQTASERRRLGLLYAAAFCLLVLAIDLNQLYAGADDGSSLVKMLPLVAFLTGALALVVLHASSRAGGDEMTAPEAPASPTPAAQSSSRNARERLASFTEWRRVRASKFEEYGLNLMEMDSPRSSTASPARVPHRRAAQADKAGDAWAKALQDFDERKSDRRL